MELTDKLLPVFWSCGGNATGVVTICVQDAR
jgi:hypothetical protein